MSVPTPEELAALSPEFLAENNSQGIYDVTIPFLVIETVIFIVFIVARLFYAERNGWETWVFHPLSYIANVGLCITSIIFIRVGGVGRHLAYHFINDPSVISKFLKIRTGGEFLYMVAITSPKISILVLYIRIFADRKFRIMAWIVIGVVVAHFFATGVIAWLLICRPFAFKWDKTLDGHCGNLMASYRYASLPNIISDVAILLLPSSQLWRLNASRMRKVGIFVTFLVGSLGIVASIIRLVGFYTVTDVETDPTYRTLHTMTYTIIEPGAYFICSCLPGIRPLVFDLYKKSTQISGSGGSYRSTGNSLSKPQDSLPLRYLSGSQDASVTTVKGHHNEGDTSGFIRLDETFDVQYSTHQHGVGMKGSAR